MGLWNGAKTWLSVFEEAEKACRALVMSNPRKMRRRTGRQLESWKLETLVASELVGDTSTRHRNGDRNKNNIGQVSCADVD